MLLAKICACSAAAVALSTPTSMQAPAADSDLNATQTTEVVQEMTVPTCQQCNFWAILPHAR